MSLSSVHPSIHPSFQPSTSHPSNHQSVLRPSIHPCTYPLIYPLCIHPSTCQPSMNLSIRLSTHPSVHPSTHASVYQLSCIYPSIHHKATLFIRLLQAEQIRHPHSFVPLANPNYCQTIPILSEKPPPQNILLQLLSALGEQRLLLLPSSITLASGTYQAGWVMIHFHQLEEKRPPSPRSYLPPAAEAGGATRPAAACTSRSTRPPVTLPTLPALCPPLPSLRLPAAPVQGHCADPGRAAGTAQGHTHTHAPSLKALT